MNNLVMRTMNDLRGGRQSWRVVMMLLIPAFAIGLATGIGLV